MNNEAPQQETPVSTTSKEVTSYIQRCKKWVFILLAIGALIYVGTYYLFFANQTLKSTSPPSPAEVSTKKDSPTTMPDDTVSTEPIRSAYWKTYTNKSFNFSIKIPSSWNVQEKLANRIILDNQLEITIIAGNPKDCHGDCPTIKSLETKTINSMRVSYVMGEEGPMAGITPQSYIQYVIPLNQKFLVFTYHEFSAFTQFDNGNFDPNRKAGKIPQGEITLFDQILSTFTFD